MEQTRTEENLTLRLQAIEKEIKIAKARLWSIKESLKSLTELQSLIKEKLQIMSENKNGQ
jgi:hypothetical protein